MKSSFANAASPFVQTLERDHGFTLVAHQQPVSFDNELFELESSSLRVVLFRERGQDCFTISARSGPRHPFDAQLLASLLGDEELRLESERSDASSARLAPRLIAHLPVLAQRFSPAEREHTESALARLGTERAEQLFGARPRPA